MIQGIRRRKEPETAPNAAEVAEKWEAQIRKGCLELAILATIGGGRLYGLEILRALEAQASLAVSEGTVYPILSRLKTEGLLESEWVEAERGHPRKYYRLTADGRKRAAEMARFWEKFAAGLTAVARPLLVAKEEEHVRP